MRHTFAVFVVAAAASAGCSKPLDPPPAPVAITQATFEPVYRASKTIQGATVSGLSLAKFHELLQALSTELAIAKDHQLNAPDRQLLDLYQQVFDTYAASAELLKSKNETHLGMYAGDIPPGEVSGIIEKYGLKPYEVTLKSGGRYRALAPGAIQELRGKAEATMGQATDLYYGPDGDPREVTRASKA